MFFFSFLFIYLFIYLFFFLVESVRPCVSSFICLLQRLCQYRHCLFLCDVLDVLLSSIASLRQSLRQYLVPSSVS